MDQTVVMLANSVDTNCIINKRRKNRESSIKSKNLHTGGLLPQIRWLIYEILYSKSYLCP